MFIFDQSSNNMESFILSFKQQFFNIIFAEVTLKS
jgi:hypothetical protein